MGENIITEKMKKPVYTDYPDYRDQPFCTSKKFGVYIPKLNDQVYDLINRHEEKRNRSHAPNNSGNIFESVNPGADQVVPGHSHNIFATSMRSNGCYDCAPQPQHVSRQNNQGQYDQETSDICQCCQTYGQCCCKNKFRIRRSSSKCDSAYSHDTNPKKTKLHGRKFGYYTNKPYPTIGSDFLGSRFYKDHPHMRDSQGSMLARPFTKITSKRKFEKTLTTDARTGESINQRSMNPVMKRLLRDSEQFSENQQVQDGIMKLKDTGCLNVPYERVKRNKPVLEKGYTYNDYHLKQTKGGYARTDNGGRSYV